MAPPLHSHPFAASLSDMHSFGGHEKAAGRDEGSKDRPVVIILIAKSDDPRGIRVGVVPITHTPPAETEGAIEMPDNVRRQRGLDNEPQWIVLDQLNRFVWPGYDLRKVPRTAADSCGMLPEALFEQILAGLLARHKARKIVIMDRD